MSCKYKIEFDDEVVYLDNEEALNKFIKENYQRLSQKLEGQKVSIVDSNSIKPEAAKQSVILNTIKQRVISQGGVENDYAENFDVKVEKPLRVLKDRGFVSITKHINEKVITFDREDGTQFEKKIILSYDEENYKKHLENTFIAELQGIKNFKSERLLDTEQLRVFNIKQREVRANSETLEQMNTYVQDILDMHNRQNVQGRMIHAAIKQALDYYRHVGDIEKFKQTFKPENLDGANEGIHELSPEAFAYAKGVIYNMLVKSNGLLDVLKLQDQSFIFPELEMMYESKDGMKKLVGIADLVVVYNDGRVKLFDFKTAGKQPDDWSHAKGFMINQQLGYYNAILQQNGLNTITDVAFVPIIVGTTNEYKYISDLSVNEPISILGNLTYSKLTPKDNYRNIRRQISEDIEDSFTKIEADLSKIDPIDAFLKKAFGVDYRDKAKKVNLDKQFEAVWKKKTYNQLGKPERSFMNPLTKEREILPEDKEAQKKIFMDARLKQIELNQGAEVISMYERAISEYKHKRNSQQNTIEKDSIPYLLKYRQSENDKINAMFVKSFGKYRGDEWELLENQVASQLGILVFINKFTKTLDFVSVTMEPVDGEFQLSTGKSLLGNVYNDVRINNDKSILPSNYGNIEMMKILAFINYNQEYLLQKNFKIGGIKVIHPFEQGTYDDFDTLRYNFYKIMEAFDLKDDYKLSRGNVYTSNPLQDLIETVVSIEEFNNAKRFGFADMSEMNAFFGTIKDYKQNSPSILQSETQQEIIELLTKELKRRLQRRSISSFSNLDEEDFFTKMIADQINYYTNLYKPNHEERLYQETLMFNSIKNIDSPLVQGTRKILSVSIENIKRTLLNYKEEMSTVTEKILQDNGYSKLRRYTLGDHSNAFLSLFEVDKKTGKLNSEFLLKDPYKDNSLKKSEKEFLIKLLTHFNRLKGISQSLEELSESGDVSFRQAPLIRKQSLSFLKSGDYMGWIKQITDKVYNPQLNLFGEDTHKEGDKSVFLEVTNFLSQQLNQDKRKEILEGGINEFETDLEIVGDIFTLVFAREREFDNALPLIQAAKITSVMDNAGVLRDITPTIDFIDKHLKIVVKGERLVENPTMQKMDKMLSVLRQITSLNNLVLNPISVVRELTASIYGVMSRAAINQYGENSHSMKDLLKQFTIIVGHSSKDVYSDLNVVEALNVVYGMSNMNLQSIIDRASTSKTGIFHFASNYLQGFNRAPEYLVRMGILLAEMIRDGQWEAHTFNPKTNNLEYDWKKDKRFSIYAKGQKTHPSYQDQRSLYLAFIQEFNRSNPDGILLKEGDALPSAYTTKQQESIKAYADSILGYYDPESKYQVMSTLFGANFFHFKNWMTAIKDKWFLHGHLSEVRGEYVKMLDEQGNQIYVDPATGGLTRDPASGIYAYVWQGKWNEGIAVSLVRLMTAQKDLGLREGLNLYQQDEKIKSNVKLMISDLFAILMMGLLTMLILGDKEKEDYTLGVQLTMAVVSAPTDLRLDMNLKSLLAPGGGWIFPSFGYTQRLASGQKSVIFGDKSGTEYLMSAFGASRPYQYLIEE